MFKVFLLISIFIDVFDDFDYHQPFNTPLMTLAVFLGLLQMFWVVKYQQKQIHQSKIKSIVKVRRAI